MELLELVLDDYFGVSIRKQKKMYDRIYKRFYSVQFTSVYFTGIGMLSDFPSWYFLILLFFHIVFSFYLLAQKMLSIYLFKKFFEGITPFELRRCLIEYREAVPPDIYKYFRNEYKFQLLNILKEANID